MGIFGGSFCGFLRQVFVEMITCAFIFKLFVVECIGPLTSNFMPRSGEGSGGRRSSVQSGPARLRVPGSQAVRCPPGGPHQQPVDSLDAVIRDP